MASNVSIYLAGNIQKKHESESLIFWTEEDKMALKRYLAPKDVLFFDPAVRSDDLSNQTSVFGRAMTQVTCSDIVFIDARERRGLGVGVEMLWAKVLSIPVLILLPPNSHYRKDHVQMLGVSIKDWTHPFLTSLGDGIVNSLEAGATWIQTYLEEGMDVKGLDAIREAMRYYQQTQFPQDTHMRELMDLCPRLQERFEKEHVVEA